MRPRTLYARTGGGHVAFQTIGDGPIDLVLIPEWASHLEVQWEQQPLARFLERLAGFSRLLLFDKRGVGVSDPLSLASLPTLEDWIDDVLAVIDAAGSRQVALVGVSAGGPLAILLAAMRPDLVRALVLFNSYARVTSAPDYPYGISPELAADAPELSERTWGTGGEFDTVAPSLAGDADARERHARLQRMSVSPGVIRRMQEMLVALDVRAVLASVRVPTLVLHRSGNTLIDPGHGRYLAERIAGAEYRELPGADQLFYAGDVDGLADEIEEFLTGTRSRARAERILTTVLFTDIVDSTPRAARLGDARWREVLDHHDEVTDRYVERYGGRRVKSTGDGALATFDGPARAIRCATAVRDALRAVDLPIRAGVHTGEVEIRGGDVGGIAVHTGARIAALGGAGEVVVSRTVVDLVAGSGIAFAEHAVVELRGVPGMFQLYRVTAG